MKAAARTSTVQFIYVTLNTPLQTMLFPTVRESIFLTVFNWK